MDDEVMLTVEELVRHLDQYLNVSVFKDYCHNGLQVQGKPNIKNIVTGVSANLEFLQEASKLKADAVIVHHGIFWKGDSTQLIGPKYNRIKCLIENDINLLAYHLPLDAHKEIGNNQSVGKLLKIKNVNYYTVGNIPGLVWAGDIEPVTGEVLAKKIGSVFKRQPIYIESDPNREITNIAWCTGAGQDFIEYASTLGVDAFITGEISERTVYLAKELNIEFFSAGHYATEVQGIKNLGQYISEKYGVNHIFCDIPNPI